MKYGEKPKTEDAANGIPGDRFEALIAEYLPITTEQIREYAVYDEKKQTYAWEPLGCLNYEPTVFGTSVPEVTEIQKNPDGTMTLKVEAVCERFLHDEAVISHELKIRMGEDGSFQYLGNQISEEDLQKVPVYQYRIPKE